MPADVKKYPFEIFFKDLKGSDPPTDSDFRAAVAASKDDPGVRQRDQPYALAEGQAGRQSRVTYYYMNGSYKRCLIETSGDRHGITAILETLRINGPQQGELAVKFKGVSPDNKPMEYVWDNVLSKRTYIEWFDTLGKQISLSHEIRAKVKSERKLEAKRQRAKDQGYKLVQQWLEMEARDKQDREHQEQSFERLLKG